MIRYIHSSRLDISIANSLQILQAAQNANVMNAGLILSRNSGFIGSSFEASMSESTTFSTSSWTLNLQPGSAFLPNGEVIDYAEGTVTLPITHFGTQYVILSKETIRMTDGVYASQFAVDDKTVYVTSKTRIRISLGGSMPNLEDNELLICKIVYPINGSPSLIDMRLAYSVYWSLPYSVSASLEPEATATALQPRTQRESSVGSSTLDTMSISHNDDPLTVIKFLFDNDPCDICNARIEKVRGSSFDWADQLHDATQNPSEATLTGQDFAITSSTYRVSFTDAFSAGLATQWSSLIALAGESGSPTIQISTVDSVAKIRIRRGTITTPNCICIIWMHTERIPSNMLPIWIGPLSNAVGEYNAGAMLSVSPSVSSVYYKVAILSQNSNVISITSGSESITPTWPKASKMIVLNLQADMTDAAHATASYDYSSDMLLKDRFSRTMPIACYHNSSSSNTIITQIDFDPSFAAEGASVAGSLYVRVNYSTTDKIKLFDIGTSVPSNRYSWPGSSVADPIVLGPGEDLGFEFVGGPNRSQGHIYIYAYSM